jgi:phosphoglycolate phosphatase-like HAD superfamily hydrolase
MNNYFKINYRENKPLSYIKKDSLDAIKKISAIIFDCDGVLIEINNSYEKAVSKTVVKLLHDLVHIQADQKDFENDVNFSFKNTGGFNNDWTLAYAFLMYTISLAPETRINELCQASTESLKFENSCDRYQIIKNKLNDTEMLDIKNLKNKLIEFSKNVDSTGFLSIERELNMNSFLPFKKAINFPAPVGKSILSTLFEQVFSGKLLFEANFHLKPCFETENEGFINNETTLVTSKTLEKLSLLFGRHRFGIASGSFEKTAKYILKNQTEWFNHNAEVWMETVDSAIEKTGKKDLHKPNPYSLLTAAKVLEPFEQILYIGDTKADLLMVQRANEVDPRFLYGGIYGDYEKGSQIREIFLQNGSEIVLSRVNELPEIIELVRSGEF